MVQVTSLRITTLKIKIQECNKIWCKVQECNRIWCKVKTKDNFNRITSSNLIKANSKTISHHKVNIHQTASIKALLWTNMVNQSTISYKCHLLNKIDHDRAFQSQLSKTFVRKMMKLLIKRFKNQRRRIDSLALADHVVVVVKLLKRRKEKEGIGKREIRGKRKNR